MRRTLVVWVLLLRCRRPQTLLAGGGRGLVLLSLLLVVVEGLYLCSVVAALLDLRLLRLLLRLQLRRLHPGCLGYSRTRLGVGEFVR